MYPETLEEKVERLCKSSEEWKAAWHKCNTERDNARYEVAELKREIDQKNVIIEALVFQVNALR